MNKTPFKSKFAVISLSGGMDSSTLLLRLLYEGYQVTALSMNYGQKHKIELERATELVKYLNEKISNLTFEEKIQWVMKNPDCELENLEITERAAYLPLIKHQIIKLDGLSQLLNSSLVEGGEEVPEGHYEDLNMVKTVVENRNKIFSSIIQSVALAVTNKNNTECVISMGIHAGDHAIYKDCRQEFRDADYKAFLEGNENAERVKYYTPYLNTDKFGILQDGEKCCKALGLDFDEIYKRTMTSYKPIKLLMYNNLGIQWEEWFSDFKSASSVERIEAFIKLGRKDPAEYADETGPVSWEVAKQHVEQILLENESK